MELKLDMTISPDQMTLALIDNQETITITEHFPTSKKEVTVSLLFKDYFLVGVVTKKSQLKNISFNHVATLSLPWDMEAAHVAQYFVTTATESGISLESDSPKMDIPSNLLPVLANYQEKIQLILTSIGFHFKVKEEKKAKPAKARHKWTKEVSQIEFHIDSRESTATIMWQKRNEMLIKKGATMKKEAPLNKDGSVGFSAKMGDKIRLDHADSFKNFTTTDDIILKSVNEVGLFLYYAGTNSWLEMKDSQGKTINEWTVVE